MRTGPVRVVLVDDHPVVRDGLRGMLAGDEDLTVVGEAGNGEEAVALVARLEPEVVLMDLRMPGCDGVEATARITSAHPGVRVLVLTTYDSEADVLRAVEAGASGYLLKDSSSAELRRAVRATAAGQTVLAPAVAAHLVRQSRTPPVDALTARELEVLELVARGATNRDVGRALHVSEATVKSHLLHAFTKLGVNDRTAAVTTALERGLIRL
ncbi:MAG TPA: response regulator transcription factor [Acidimicrobiales bacterium]|nr:response regulator transcription factor [Acidimicrobiales bacterium]